MNYLQVIDKAKKGELTAHDICHIVLAFDENNRIRDKRSALDHRDIQDFKDEITILPAEADDISLAVRKKGVEILGGKGSAAYKDKDLRKRVYSDIYLCLKREFGLINEKGGQMSYKKLKRKYLENAKSVIAMYVPPMAIEDEIQSTNDVGEVED